MWKNAGKVLLSSGISLLVWMSHGSFCSTSDAFSLPLSSSSSSQFKTVRPTRRMDSRLYASLHNNNDNDDDDVMLVRNRNVIGGLASVGLLETMYLTYEKYVSGADSLAFCSSTASASSCMSVLDSSYAMIGTTDIPLSAVGIMAYGLVLALVVAEKNNTLVLTFLVTTMATISIFLLSLLITTLHQSCIYCYLSATLCITMAYLTNFNQNNNAKAVLPSILTGTALSVLLFVSSSSPSQQQAQLVASSTTGVVTSSVLVADNTNTPKQQKLFSPPPVTTTSSKEAMTIAQELKNAGAKLYGAYWCSHCYDQKQSLGQPAVSYIQYIECSKDGINSQTPLCKSNDIPGYPTWEINGQFYPGEQSLEELNEILQKK